MSGPSLGKCVMAALKKQDTPMKAFFSTRVADHRALMAEGRQRCEGREEVMWIESSLKPMSDISLGSRW